MRWACLEKKSLVDPRVQDIDVRSRRHVWRLLWLKLLMLELVQHVVFLDETGFKVWMCRTHGRAPRGQRIKMTGRRRSRQYTLVMAMNVDGVLVEWVFPKGMTDKRWHQFIRDHLLPVLDPMSIVLWDNLSQHYLEEPLRWLHGAGIRVLYQPPYSPECNPIEEAFSKIKTLVRGKGSRCAASLREAIAWAIEQLTRRDIQGWLIHSLEQVATWEIDLSHEIN